MTMPDPAGPATSHMQTASKQDNRWPLAGPIIAVIGAGRIGAELLRNLGLMGFSHVDVYESNPRAADPLRARYHVIDGDFWDTLTLARLSRYAFVVCTLDAQSARLRANRKCLIANVNLVQAWTEDARAVVSVHPFAATADAACFECDAARAPTPLPIASLKLSVAEAAPDGAAERVATASVAGALAAALVARVAAGSHGGHARRATLDATLGDGLSLELNRDPDCPRCRALQRPVPIVHTRNRWALSDAVVQACPDLLDQRLQLSDDIDGLADDSCCVRELALRFQGGPVPAKFALTEISGRVICLDFEDCEPATARRVARDVAGGQNVN